MISIEVEFITTDDKSRKDMGPKRLTEAQVLKVSFSTVLQFRMSTIELAENRKLS